MDKLQQLKQNLDDFKNKTDLLGNYDSINAEELQRDYEEEIYKPFTELLLELGLNEDKAEEGVDV